MSLITLITDFGQKDPFVGIMKGVIISINPEAGIIDITHEIPPGNIKEAAFIVWESFGYFPAGTICVVVVDPGVGSGRRPLLVEASGRYFIGPDNGVFTMMKETGGARVFHITKERFFLEKRGSTFHGRDVFAPSAAWLSKGVLPSEFGPEISDPVAIEFPRASVGKNSIEGEVIRIDRFGNAITNIGADILMALIGNRPKGGLKIKIKDVETDLRGFYSEAGDGKSHAVINSSGLLEIFIYMGDAKKTLGVKAGDPVTVTVS